MTKSQSGRTQNELPRKWATGKDGYTASLQAATEGGPSEVKDHVGVAAWEEPDKMEI